MKRQLFIILIFTVLTGCNGLHVGVGLKGEIVDEDTIVLEGDTLTIHERIGDSLLVVWNYEHSEDKTPCYLLKYERNGFFYPQIGATSITSIGNTLDDAIKNAYKGVEKITFKDAHYRKDIGIK